MKTNLLILLLCLSAGVAAGSLLLRDPGSDPSGRLLVGAALHRNSEFDELPGPLIQTGSPYLAGRGLWLSEYFNGILVDALRADARLRPNPRVVIHRQPFSDGPWLEALEERESEKRRLTESQTVESHLLVELAEVSGKRLLQFLVFSGYQKRIEGIGKLEREIFFPPLAHPLPGLDGELVIEPHQFVCRERTQRPEFLAQPTACYYLFDAHRLGETYLLRYDLLANLSGKNHATIRLSAGQYVITPSDTGTRLHHVALYSGQSMPALFDEFVKNHSVDFFQKMAKTIRSLVVEWAVPPEADEWVATALQ